MRSWGTGLVATALALALGGCTSDDPEPTQLPPFSETSSTDIPDFNPDLEASAAVLPLVPSDAVDLTVTDFDQIRLQLGVPDLDGGDPKRERDQFWQQAAAEAPLLLGGMLRDIDDQLRREYGWSQDDVAWEAHFGGPDGVGWVLKIRDDLPMGDIIRAVDAGIGPLEGAVVRGEDHVVVHNGADDGTESWAADADLVDLVGTPGSATYVSRECIPFDDVFGSGVKEALAPSPSADVEALEELGAYSVTFGGELVTVRLGPERSDVFDRMRLPEKLPETDPEFGRGYRRGAADPLGGRIGWDLGDPAIAAELALDKELPFALCAE
ncbi:MAG: hypothetical protein M3237_20355 [Actinomycetota bacterium]|nr:hypothetical protein [Actinomycetota bacterium]